MAPHKMQYHVLTTERCNLRCRYCGGTRHLPGIPLDIEYKMEDLVAFIGKDQEAVIGFYGGEPLIALDRMKEIMDRVPAKAFTLQTNGVRESSPSIILLVERQILSNHFLPHPSVLFANRHLPPQTHSISQSVHGDPTRHEFFSVSGVEVVRDPTLEYFNSGAMGHVSIDPDVMIEKESTPAPHHM